MYSVESFVAAAQRTVVQMKNGSIVTLHWSEEYKGQPAVYEILQHLEHHEYGRGKVKELAMICRDSEWVLIVQTFDKANQ